MRLYSSRESPSKSGVDGLEVDIGRSMLSDGWRGELVEEVGETKLASGVVSEPGDVSEIAILHAERLGHRRVARAVLVREVRRKSIIHVFRAVHDTGGETEMSESELGTGLGRIESLRLLRLG